MPELTNKEKCIKMWEWLAENPEKNKHLCPMFIDDRNMDDHFYCYACKEIGRTLDNETGCSKCPIEWVDIVFDDDEDPPCVYKESLYSKWSNSYLREVKGSCAMEIVTLIKETWK